MTLRHLSLSFAPCALAGSASAQTPAAPSGPITLATSLQRQQAAILRNLVESAEKVPEADYAFKATTEIRTFGQFVGHVANSQFQLCAAAKGEANPNAEDFEKSVGKTALVAALEKSGDYCTAVYAGTIDSSVMEQVKTGPATVTRAAILASNIAHNNEHSGDRTPPRRPREPRSMRRRAQ
jgi:hypothetical protein